jgi:hypothetical protein
MNHYRATTMPPGIQSWWENPKAATATHVPRQMGYGGGVECQTSSTVSVKLKSSHRTATMQATGTGIARTERRGRVVGVFVFDYR